jgi:arsenate reductase
LREGGRWLSALAFKDTYRMLDQRIDIFTSLPLRALDRPSLQKKLGEIGRMSGVTAKTAEPT